MDQVPEDRWDSPEKLGMFRLNKFYTNVLFDGQLHLVRRGYDFPATMADADISQRLRNAASYRKVKVALAFTPTGILVQAHGPGAKPTRDETLENLAQQLIQALEEKEALEEALFLFEQLRDEGTALQAQVTELVSRVKILEACVLD
jgi:hypothetical protein